MGLEKIVGKLENVAGRITGRTRIKELEQENAALKEEATDPLTGLPMVGHFRRRLDAAISDYLADNKNYFAFVDTDLAGLKYANKLGAGTVGDELLATQAGVIRSYTEISPLTRRDTIARRGGDEMSYLFTGAEAPVRERAVIARDNIYRRQKILNNKTNKEEFIDGIELCMGVAIMTPEDIPSEYLKMPADKNSIDGIRKHLFDIAEKRTSSDKVAQGIYIRHPEYKR